MPDKILGILATNVRRLRKTKGWSQEELAQRCRLHRTYLGAVERAERNITLSSLDKIASALGTQPSALISRQKDT